MRFGEVRSNTGTWDDFRVPISSARIPSSNPPGIQAFKGGQVLSFSSASDNYIYFTVQTPHTWIEGSTLKPHLHYVIPSAGAGGGAENVKFDLTYSIADRLSEFPAEDTLTATVDVQSLVADTHYTLSLGDLTMTGKSVSCIIICSLKRDTTVASDYASAVYLLDIDFHYQSDSLGSRQEYSK